MDTDKGSAGQVDCCATGASCCSPTPGGRPVQVLAGVVLLLAGFWRLYSLV